MARPSWSEIERQAMAETFLAVGPGAPTLCEGWRSEQLLAHVVLRERRPWAIALDSRGRPEPGSEPRQSEVADAAGTPEGYEELVAQLLDDGGLRPTRRLGDAVNLLEFVVHHEDLRRAGPEHAEPRRLPEEMQEAVWRRLQPMARVAARRSPVGVVLVSTTGPRAVVRRGADAVALVGEPVELALHLMGRPEQAAVELLGMPGTVARYRESLSAG